MTITIFAKKKNTTDGKTFYTYLATLKKKDGTEQTVSVKFRDEAGTPKPEKCPMNIIIDKKNANLSKKDFVKDDGETYTSFTLWVSEWLQGAPYVDTSLDDFAD